MSPAARRALARDAKLSPYVRALEPLKPGRGAFASLAMSIVYQQLSGASARAIHARLRAACGGRVTPARVLALRAPQLRRAGLSRQKAAYLRDLASAFQQKRIDPARLRSQPDARVLAELTAVKGIGRWTAEMFLIFHLGRPDVFPAHDLGIQKAVAHLYGIRNPTPKRLDAFAARWKPYRSTASLALWRVLDAAPSEQW